MSVYQKHALDYLSYIYNVEIYGKNHENTPPPTELYANILVHLVGTKRINNDKFTQNSHGIINDTLLPTYMYRPLPAARNTYFTHSRGCRARHAADERSKHNRPGCEGSPRPYFPRSSVAETVQTNQKIKKSENSAACLCPLVHRTRQVSVLRRLLRTYFLFSFRNMADQQADQGGAAAAGEEVQADAVAGGGGGALSGKVALVTGATGGIGSCICRSLAALGANIVAVDLSAEKCQELADELPTKSAGFAINIADDAAVKAGMEDVVAVFPDGIDILVNVAGMVYVWVVARCWEFTAPSTACQRTIRAV